MTINIIDSDTYGNLSYLFDVKLKIPINYLMSNDGKRQLLIKQFDSLNIVKKQEFGKKCNK